MPSVESFTKSCRVKLGLRYSVSLSRTASIILPLMPVVWSCSSCVPPANVPAPFANVPAPLLSWLAPLASLPAPPLSSLAPLASCDAPAFHSVAPCVSWLAAATYEVMPSFSGSQLGATWARAVDADS